MSADRPPGSSARPPDAPDRARQAWTSREKLALGLSAAVGAWLCGTLGVFSQEAYYWTWAQHPDLSYYDHPPMVAWLIWLGTRLLGDGAAGIRLATWLAGCGTTLLGLRMLREFGVGERGRIAWILISLGVPALALLRFLANPDPPLVFFWTLSVLLLWRARAGGIGGWVAAGAAVGCALLSKYTAVFLGIGGLVVLILDPAMRAQLRRPGVYLAVLTSVVVFLPVIVWNVGNDFESFRFQSADRYEKASLGLHWLPQCLLTQFLVVNPVFALLLPGLLAWLWRRARQHDVRALWILAFGLPLPLFLLANSLFLQVKINWFTPAYAVLGLGGAMWWGETRWFEERPRWRRAAVVSVASLLAVVPLSPVAALVPATRGSSWNGWDEIAPRAEHWEEAIDGADGVEGNVFFAAADYHDASQLFLALRRHVVTLGEPGDVVEPVLGENAFGASSHAFDHWTRPVDLAGRDAIVVVASPIDREHRVNNVRRCFHEVTLVESVGVTRLGIQVLAADIYVCRGYTPPHDTVRTGRAPEVDDPCRSPTRAVPRSGRQSSSR